MPQLRSRQQYSILVGSPIEIGMYSLMGLVLVAAFVRRFQNKRADAKREKEGEEMATV